MISLKIPDAEDRIIFPNKNCRSCRSENLSEILDFGEQFLANDLKFDINQENEAFLLRLVLCGTCGLVQIDVDVPPERLFKQYNYFSSFSKTMQKHIDLLTNELVAKHQLNEKSLVIEAASNDGYLLQNYRSLGIPVLGIEPAKNIADLATKEKNIPTLNEFFCESLGRKLSEVGRTCDVFHAHNVFAHVPDPGDFLRGVSHCLKEGGIAVIEAPYVVDLVEKLEFDTIYHEHYSYFSVSAVNQLAVNSGLNLEKVQRISIHGGSVRYYLRKSSVQHDDLIKLLKHEDEKGVSQDHYYSNFAKNVEKLLEDLRGLILEITKSGKTLAIYGASAKGSTLLQTLGLETYKCFEFAVDISPHKQGKFLPGSQIQIHHPEYLLSKMPDYTFLLSWNFADEIIKKIST